MLLLNISKNIFKIARAQRQQTMNSQLVVDTQSLTETQLNLKEIVVYCRSSGDALHFIIAAGGVLLGSLAMREMGGWR